jgi:mRNA-degrading endonuclease toxin of MazEF toxin-antitoxin module
MTKLYRGDVIEVYYPDGNGGLKVRPVIVLQNVNKNSDVISVYCTTQNNGDDMNNLFVRCDSDEGRQMGIIKDTYIRPNVIKTLPLKALKRLIGTCPLMKEISKIIDDNASKKL